MKLSSRTEYGVRAMAELAEHWGHGNVPLREVAARQEIPESYLEQLFGSLRRAGLITGQRGAQGGYTLARAPSEISVGDVMRALEGPISICGCAGEKGNDDEGECSRMGNCAAHTVWVRLQGQITSLLDSTTLSDMNAGKDSTMDFIGRVSNEQDIS